MRFAQWKHSCLRLGSFPMTEATDLDAARIEFMDCAVEGAAGTGGKNEELEAREA